MGLTVAQCRAARALLNWTMTDLANAASVGVMTVNRFEGGKTVNAASLERLAATLTGAGVTLLSHGDQSHDGGEGVRLTATHPTEG